MITTDLATYAATLRFEALPLDVIARTKTLIRDALGIALYVSQGTPWGQIVTDFALQETDQGVSSVIGAAGKSTASAAALANGTMFLGFELEDTSPHMHGHIGPPTIAAALAIGEKVNASGAEVITAVVAGYDVMGRVGSGVSEHLILSGLHPTANLGAFGAAVAAGKLLNLETTDMLNAIGLASVQAGGTMQSLNEGAMSRRLYGGRPAQSGVIAADLASRGFTGPHEALEGLQGFGVAYTGSDIDWSAYTTDLGERFEVMQTTFKPHASCQVFHAAIDAMTALRQEHDITPQDVEEIVGEIKFISPIHANANPQTIMAAQYSFPYCMAAALHTGSVGPAAFTDSMMARPDIRATAACVQTTFPDDLKASEVFSGRVAVRLKDGQTHRLEVPYPKGDPQNPLSDHDLETKFRQLATARLTEDQAGQLSTVCNELERLPRLDPLLSLLTSRP